MLADYVEQFKRFRVFKARGVEKVHKPCMLLAVIDLGERGALTDNRVRYEETLDGFREYAEALRPDEGLEPHFPFYHLRTSAFWSPDPDDTVVPRHSAMMGRSAVLDAELRRLICKDADARFELRQALIERWFPNEHAVVHEVIERRRLANQYESGLRAADEPLSAEDVPDSARSRTFRRLVLEAYDYRCAATGWRILLPGPRAIVEAAHLVPWADSHDDRPSNGIALTPTYHRALDWHLIAPGPDLRWHVSDALDERIPDNQALLALAGKSVIHGERHRPAREALEWRYAHLLNGG